MRLLEEGPISLMSNEISALQRQISSQLADVALRMRPVLVADVVSFIALSCVKSGLI